MVTSSVDASVAAALEVSSVAASLADASAATSASSGSSDSIAVVVSSAASASSTAALASPASSSSTAASASAPAASAAIALMLLTGIHAETAKMAAVIIAVTCFLFICPLPCCSCSWPAMLAMVVFSRH